MKTQGFTLVEVIVSFAIVAVLASVVFCMANSSIHAAKSTACVSNLHQLAQACSLYEQDQGDYPPDNEHYPALMTYLGNARLVCPFKDIAQSQDPSRLRIDYFILGSNPVPTPAQQNCAQLRGSSYPLTYDHNHVSPLVARSAGSAFYLFARRDTSIGREDMRQADGFLLDPHGYPCPGATMYSNFK